MIFKVILFYIKSLFSYNHKILKVRYPNQTDPKTLLGPLDILAALTPELLTQLKQLAFFDDGLHSRIIGHLQHILHILASQQLSPISDQ
jgi:hypothetical protein